MTLVGSFDESTFKSTHLNSGETGSELLVVPWFLLKLVTSTGNVAIGMTGLVAIDPVVDVVVTVADGMAASSKPTTRESLDCRTERGSVGKV